MSKLFSVSQIQAWDTYTIEHEPISSIELMERAAKECVAWIIQKWPDTDTTFAIFCGNGNNGGDGLAIARLLILSAYHVNVCLIDNSKRSEDNAAMLKELEFLYKRCIVYISKCPVIDSNVVIVDALFGTGLSRRPVGLIEELIGFFNSAPNTIVSIDIPSGLPADAIMPQGEVVNSDYTLTFQQYKPSFLFPETGRFCGKLSILDIGLHPVFSLNETTESFILDEEIVRSVYKKRNEFSHKGNYGNALLIVGSHGKMGAAVLASKACMRSGAGLLTVLVPSEENMIIQVSVPEAMTMDYTEASYDFTKFNSIGIGCGFGIDLNAFNILVQLLQQYREPMILDADALNLLSLHNELLDLVPAGSLLTPHPKEFDRLFGECSNSFDRNKQQIKMSEKYKLFIILKGRNTSISTPEGCCYYNITGNAGMAKGGSGDTLTGILTALYAQYHSMLSAALLGVYLHGLAGDVAATKFSKESMLATDLIECLGDAFLRFESA